MDREQGDRLHVKDERLIDAALARLVPPFQAAPDGDECAGEARKPTCQATQEAGACIPDWPGPERRRRPAKQQVATIGDQETTHDVSIDAGIKVQQQIDADGYAENTA